MQASFAHPMDKLVFHNISLAYDARNASQKRLFRNKKARQDTASVLQVIDGLSLSVKDGESVCIIGPSGCGKSSLLRLAAGLARPTSGEVLVCGKPISEPRDRTALILQDFGLLPWKNVYKNAEIGLKFRHVPKNVRQSKANEALELVGLMDSGELYPSELSGGMKQRCAIARALSLDVDLMLMDEPMSALDAILRERMQSLILDLWKEKRYTQVLVTHSVEEAIFLGQRIFVMGPKPSRVADVFENDLVGRMDVRDSSEFFEMCSRLRASLLV